ncbi:hypothetical protein [Terracoccus luteus]|uniref:Uncharacterized protein n=1 Tax=Terracoccus luteus TaxID=53356 RepID=A0A839PVY8_9MICO|nr:hypothetical protein [Terracoccus luteus]MBB2988260.1 hypothetical protein [Terracoccus luteus]MCP2173895.1 hypothetical protein [Terracoccus luteus]
MTAVVHNNSTYVGQTVTVNFNVLDSAGALLKTESQVEAFYRPGADHALGTQVILEPGQKAANVEASLDVEANGAFSDKPFPVAPTSPLKIFKDEFGQNIASFELTNPLVAAMKSPRIQVVCTNKDAGIVGGGMSFPELVPASGKVRVDANILISRKAAACTAYVGPDPSWDGEGISAVDALASTSTTDTSTPQMNGSAEAAFETWVEQFNAKDWGGQYETLVSAQKAIVSKGVYIACRSSSPTPTFTWVKLLSVTDSGADVIPGTRARLPSVKVTAQVSMQGAKEPVTAHMYQEDGQWRWSMTQENLDGCA